jgi:hypothetical protein
MHAMNQSNENMEIKATGSLGDRILAAAQLAACVHLELEFLERFQTSSFSSGQQVTAGGAGQNHITDDGLPSTAESEAAK